MTPQREAYLAKCSDKEKILRHRISGYLFEIQREKYILNTEGGLVDMDRYKSKLRIKRYKYHLNAYRHELSKVKGMDKAVAPRKAYIGAWGDKGGLCKCGKHITDVYNYCPWCGKRLLWEKVK